MCGIVGLVNHGDRSLLAKMNESQVHRGPDFGGCYWNDEKKLGLAMRRLSIVDLSGGGQPMYNENESIVLVFNGEIFNAPKLRKELINQGHIFKSVSSDTEVLVHLYEEHGLDMLNMLNGMFAFAIYDIKKNILFLARDQMGIKPLNYIHKGKAMAFASEIKSLIQVGLSEKKLNTKSIWEYLSFQCVPAPNTIYEDVKVLPAAHYILFDISTGKLNIERYWDCIANRKVYEGSKEDLSEYVRENIEQAVERWTMSDVPLACSLSGGLDSSIIAALIGQKHDLHTYSLGFEENCEYDETNLAKKLASMYGTKHEEIILTPDDLLQDMGKIIKALDMPYAGGVPSWFVFRRISGQEKVVFNGTGGDELFGNYSKWLRYEHPLERIRQCQHVVNWGESVKEVLAYPEGSIYHKYMPEKMKQRCLLTGDRQPESINKYIQILLNDCPSKEWRDKIPYVDFRIQLPEEFLMMLDRFSMHFSIEARVPFLDRELVENILGIPAELRTQKYNAKYLLKSAMGDLIPDEHLRATKKGFVLPYREWLKGKLRTAVIDLCTGEYIRKQGIFSGELEEKLITPFYKGNDGLTPLVWTVLMFQVWYENEEINFG